MRIMAVITWNAKDVMYLKGIHSHVERARALLPHVPPPGICTDPVIGTLLHLLEEDRAPLVIRLLQNHFAPWSLMGECNQLHYPETTVGWKRMGIAMQPIGIAR